ncbi:LEA type 2 family protein [Oligoflexia bacterium]|nr:LEA type 2 family protein [Oligoflexia bacterium]
MVKAALISILCVTVVACTPMQIIKPEVALVDLQFGEVTLLETQLVATVRYENENATPITIDGSVHRIYLNGIDTGKALSDEQLHIPRLGTASQTVTLRISNLSFLTKIQKLIESNDFRYRIDSKIYVKQGLGRRSVTVSRQGRIGFDDLLGQPAPTSYN